MNASVLAAGAAFLVTWITLAIALRIRLSELFRDLPNERSLHERPVPRIGGLGILTGVASTLLTLPGMPGWMRFFLAGYLALAIVSAIDDRGHLPASLRLLLHAAVALGWILAAELPPWTWLPATLILVWSINLFNFMDGANGLAGSMAVIGFAAYALAAGDAGAPQLAALCWVLAACALAFLWFNFDPARMFLGDGGSIPLGFSAGALGLYGVDQGLWNGWFPVLAFLPFVLDATYTLLRRMLCGEAFWKPHRQHLYQQVVLAGMSHRAMTLRAAGLMLVCAAGALVSRHSPWWGQGLIICGLLGAFVLLAARIQRPGPEH